jgi:hypothetical protein
MDSPLHKTCDPYLASFLSSQKAVLAGGARLGPKKVEFRFVADRRLHDLLRLYWSNEPVLIVPSRLMDCLRTLKSRSFTRA